MDIKTRRLKVVCVRTQDVLDVFGWYGHHVPEFQSGLVLEPLPAGYEVIAVETDWKDRLFKILVAHPSFEEVPNGAYIPYYEGRDVRAVRTDAISDSTIGNADTFTVGYRRLLD